MNDTIIEKAEGSLHYHTSEDQFLPPVHDTNPTFVQQFLAFDLDCQSDS